MKCCKVKADLYSFAGKLLSMSTATIGITAGATDKLVQHLAVNAKNPFEAALLRPFESDRNSATGALYFNDVRWAIQDSVNKCHAPNFDRVTFAASYLLEYFNLRQAGLIADEQLTRWAKRWQELSPSDRDLATRWALGLLFNGADVSQKCNACSEQSDDGIWFEDYRDEFPEEGPRYIKDFVLPMTTLMRLCQQPERISEEIDLLQSGWLTPVGWKMLRDGVRALYEARGEEPYFEIQVPACDSRQLAPAQINFFA